MRRSAWGLLLLGWCVSGAALAGTLAGTASYRERIALPPGAVFEAELQDVSRADAPATVLGRATLDPAGQPPFRFEIRYDDAAVQPGRRYAVRATVRHEGRLLYTTDRTHPVFDGRAAPLQLRLVRVRDGATAKPVSPAAVVGPLPASFAGEVPDAGGATRWHVDLYPDGRYQLRQTYVGRPEPNRFDDVGRWTHDDRNRLVLRGGREAPVFFVPFEGGAALRKLDLAGRPIPSGQNDLLRRLPEPQPLEPRLLLQGLFVHLADAPSITLCVDGQRLPVAMEADYRALEAAYREARAQPGAPVLVTLEGLIARRPAAEAGRPPRATLVVERFVGAWPRESCGNVAADSPLRGTYWKLVRLHDAPVAAAPAQREAHLLFATDAPRVGGSGGCNRLAGGFELDGAKLRFGDLAATMMACADGMEDERRFLDALQGVERHRIRGSHLELLDGKGDVVARLEAVALR